MYVNRIIIVSYCFIILMAQSGQCSRTYTHTITVGQGGGYDYDNINDAIEAMNEVSPPLSSSVIGKIEVYDGVYNEQFNEYYGGNHLPAHCDLIGQGSNLVTIQHGSEYPTYACLKCNGDNIVSGIKVHNNGLGQDSIEFIGIPGTESRLEDCEIISYHCSFKCFDGNLIISGCTIKGKYGACIQIDCDSFEVSDCILVPFSSGYLETPTGIRILGSSSGTVEDVSISQLNGSGAYFSDGAGLIGIQHKGNASSEVIISNVNINLTLTSQYYSGYTAALRVCGIMNGFNYYPPGNYPGSIVVDNCTISVKGIEGIYDGPDGAGIMVDGICVRAGGTVEVYDTSITTDRTEADNAEDGYEHLLYAENGTITVNRNTCNFNLNGSNLPDRFDRDYVAIDESYGELINEWETEYVVRNSNGDGVAWFDKYGNLGLKGEITDGEGTISSAPAGSFILKDSSDNIVAYIDSNGDMVLAGSWSESNGTCSPGSDAFIIKPSYSNVGYIDFSGNLCLKKLLYQNDYPIE